MILQDNPGLNNVNKLNDLLKSYTKYNTGCVIRLDNLRYYVRSLLGQSSNYIYELYICLKKYISILLKEYLIN